MAEQSPGKAARQVASPRRFVHPIKIVMLNAFGMGNRGLRGIRLWRGRGWLWRLALCLFVLLLAGPIFLLLLYRFVPVPGTPEMLVSLIEGNGAHYSWTSRHLTPAGAGGDRWGRGPEFLHPSRL